MSFTTAQWALLGAVQAIPGAPAIVFPNHRGETPPLPRWVVQVSANAGRTLGISGLTNAVSEIVVRVEVEDGQTNIDAMLSVQKLEAAFPVGRTIPSPDGDLVIDTAPSPRPAMQGDGIYAVPVIIQARHGF